MTRKILIILLISTLTQIGFAQTFDKTKLDNYFNSLETNNKFMGSVAVSKDGVIIYTKTIGFSDIENNLKAGENSKYRIGSISKTFTSVLILKAVEENKLDLNQMIYKYFPTIKNSKKINIKLLLSHRSGIHDFTDDKDFLTWNTQPKTKQEMVRIISKAGSDFKPNSKNEYSNSNFVLLTYILEEIFNKPYSELLQEYIIEPVGLHNTYFGGKIDSNNNECKSYSFSGSWKLEPETDTSIPLGAGGIISTPSDLTKFSNALFSEKLLKKESLDIMKTIKNGYGIGLFQIPFYDRIGYGHSGGIDGFSSAFSFFSDGNISYALTSNGTNFNNNDISFAVLSAIYDKPFDIPKFKL
jgi:CubicO group peptidase (beta-lactamase class C family)